MSETPAESPEGDVTSPSYEQLLPPALASTLRRRGFSELTEIQRAVAVSDTTKVDLRLSSQTGSGKTVAVGIALARQLLEEGGREKGDARPSVLVLAPTRELAGQVQKELDWLLKEVEDASTEVVTGGTSVGLDRKHLARGPRVLVGTPGRVLDHLGSGALDPTGLSLVILDEADQMLDMGFREELESILEQVPATRRTHLVSATFSGEVLAIAKRVQANFAHIEGSPLGRANTDITHVAHVVPERHKLDALINVLLAHLGQAEPGDALRVLVFTRTRADTAEVAERLQKSSFRAEPLSGDMAQLSRTRTLEAFRRGRVPIIVATDVAARGLDVSGVTLVVHYDPPGDPDAMTHRSGRTGRAGQKGTSVLLLPPQARRRVERLLAQARLQPTWCPVPTPEKINKLFLKQGRRRLFSQLAEEPSEEALSYAQKLLGEQAADRVIAALLAFVDQRPPCTPREMSFHFTHDQARHEGRDRKPRPSHGGGSRSRGGAPGFRDAERGRGRGGGGGGGWGRKHGTGAASRPTSSSQGAWAAPGDRTGPAKPAPFRKRRPPKT